MEKIARKLTDLIGNTPLLELSNYNTSNDLKARLIVKIESFNPAGSVKDRIALAMIEDAETKGILHVLLYENHRIKSIPSFPLTEGIATYILKTSEKI